MKKQIPSAETLRSRAARLLEQASELDRASTRTNYAARIAGRPALVDALNAKYAGTAWTQPASMEDNCIRWVKVVRFRPCPFTQTDIRYDTLRLVVVHRKGDARSELLADQDIPYVWSSAAQAGFRTSVDPKLFDELSAEIHALEKRLCQTAELGQNKPRPRKTGKGSS